jgi:integrase
MPEITFHALRHTHASQLIDAGVDIMTISKRLGHAKPDIILRITRTCSGRMTARPHGDRRSTGIKAIAKFTFVLPVAQLSC